MLNEIPWNPEFFRQTYEELKTQYIFRRAEEYEDEIMCIFNGIESGAACPFVRGLHFRKGEVTLWGAPNGNGKSLLTGQISMQLADGVDRVAIMSFEMLPKYTFARLARQRLGSKHVRVEDLHRFFEAYHNSLFVLDHKGAIDYQAVMGATIVAVRDFRCTHVVIDNLSKIVSGDTDLDSQKEVVQAICDLAQQLNVHIHLVHHVRKTKDEAEELNKFSFKGSSAIVDQVDNAILIQRNRVKEKKREEGTLSYQEDADSGDTIMQVVKQRNGDWEGRIHLWFNTAANAFCEDVSRRTPWQGGEQ